MSILSPGIPCARLPSSRSATSERFVVKTRATTPSSRNGNRASRPWSAISRSSRPRFRFHKRHMSSLNTSLSAGQFPVAVLVVSVVVSSRKLFAPAATSASTALKKTLRCRRYPAHCSSAPCPSKSTFAFDLYNCFCFVDPSKVSIQPSPRAANQSAAPMFTSITVFDGSSVLRSRFRTSSTSAILWSIAMSLHLRVGKFSLSSQRLSSADSRSGDLPPLKHTVHKSITASGGTYRCASAARSALSTPPENKTPRKAVSGSVPSPFVSSQPVMLMLKATLFSTAHASAAMNPSIAASCLVLYPVLTFCEEELVARPFLSTLGFTSALSRSYKRSASAVASRQSCFCILISCVRKGTLYNPGSISRQKGLECSFSFSSPCLAGRNEADEDKINRSSRSSGS
mmetsp:Transcript_5174/g.19372  ORF Transcript_5174/g.19372 Transcript_5174/m.19372 type:complete len:400 (+) Transcript_5174:552-1751(+)